MCRGETPRPPFYRVKAYVESREQFLLITDLTILGKEAYPGDERTNCQAQVRGIQQELNNGGGQKTKSRISWQIDRTSRRTVVETIR